MLTRVELDHKLQLSFGQTLSSLVSPQHICSSSSPWQKTLWSPYWRGLIWGRTLLQLGLGWKVGGGPQITIREDNWLSGSTYFKLYHPRKVSTHLIKVVDLIENITDSWHKTLFDQYFSPIDSDRILQILFASFFVADKLTWIPALDGEFNVKRAYWFDYHIN